MSACAKIVGGRGSAPDPAGGAYDAPPDPLVGFWTFCLLLCLVLNSILATPLVLH